MSSRPRRALRCQHVTTGGVQCDSPALRKLRYCYYHQQGRSTAIQYYNEAPFTALEGDLPLFEDAHSIQIAIRQIASSLLQQKIDHKAAGLLLYSLQLAFMNLKQMKAEKPQPAQIVVDTEKIEKSMPPPKPVESAPQLQANVEPPKKPASSVRSRNKKSSVSEEDLQLQLEYFLELGKHLDAPGGTMPDMETFMRLKKAEKEAAKEAAAKLPPGTIQACARALRSEKRPHVGTAALGCPAGRSPAAIV